MADTRTDGKGESMTESQLMHQILWACTRDPSVRLWRNHVAVAVPIRGESTPQRFGQPGSPDLMGSVTVNGVAIALGIEVKTHTGRVSDLQRAWLAAHRALGWRCGVARSVDDALAIVRGENP